MAQIEPKTIPQTYLEHPGSNQPETEHQKSQKQCRYQQPRRISWLPQKNFVEPIEKNYQILI